MVDLTGQPLTTARSRLPIGVDFTGHGIGKVLVPLTVRREAAKKMPVSGATLKRRLEKLPGSGALHPSSAQGGRPGGSCPIGRGPAISGHTARWRWPVHVVDKFGATGVGC